MKYFGLLIVLFISTAGCSTDTSNKPQGEDNESMQYVITNPTAEEILSENSDADIFVMNETVYIEADDIDWVKELDLTLGNMDLEITNQSNNGVDFVEGTASKLPIGTKIYKPIEKGNIYIAVVDGKEIRYLGMVEG